MKPKHFSMLALTVGALLAASPVFAETAAPPANDQNSPTHFDAQANRPGAQNQTLSDRLDRTNGIIRPPAHVDPEIHEAPPPTGDKMVVPAPGTPGGDQTVKPK